MAICKHFGVCGGCTLQNISYEEQLKLKQSKVAQLIKPYYDGELAITPSPDIEYFRNKIELSFSHQVVWKEPVGKKKVIRDKTIPLEFESALGFRVKGRWDRCIDLQDCTLINAKLPEFVESIRGWAAQNNLDYYDQRTHKGILRNIIVRESKNTPQGMVVLISSAAFNTSGLVDEISKVYPEYNVLTAVNEGLSDGSGLTDIKVLKGEAIMREAILIEGRELFFELSPQSFFQTNTKAANLMYSRVRTLVKALNPEVMYDLYGGAGSFSLCCAEIVGKSLCVESVAPAILNGQQNATLNGIANVSFYCEKTEDFLTKNKLSAHNSVIVLDPPRSGLHPKACEAVLKSGVQNVLYISCNPVTLAENLKILTQNYKVTNAECFDFFPHTEHIETLVELKLK